MMLACFPCTCTCKQDCSETTWKHSVTIVCSVQMIGTKTWLIHMQTCQTKLLSRADGMTNGLRCANFSRLPPKLKNASRWCSNISSAKKFKQGKPGIPTIPSPTLTVWCLGRYVDFGWLHEKSGPNVGLFGRPPIEQLAGGPQVAMWKGNAAYMLHSWLQWLKATRLAYNLHSLPAYTSRKKHGKLIVITKTV